MRIPHVLRFTWMGVAAVVGLVASAPVAAQQSIAGTVLDDDTGRPIASATVRLIGEDGVAAGVSTGADGAFFFDLPMPGEWQIEAERIGYRTARSTPLTVELGSNLTVEFRLRTEAVLLEPLLVTADSRAGRNAFARREAEWGRGQFFGPEEIEAMDLHYAADFFRHTDDVLMTWRMARGASGNFEAVPAVRVFRGRGCFNYMVDWLQVRLDPLVPSMNPWSHFPLSSLEQEDIQAVEVYRYPGEAPPEIRRFVNQSGIAFTDSGIQERDLDMCGLVVIWTKAGW